MVAVIQLEVFPQNLAERPVRNAVAIGKTVARASERRSFFVIEGRPELARQSRLPHARFAEERDEVRLGVGSCSAVRRSEHLELALPAHEAALESPGSARST